VSHLRLLPAPVPQMTSDEACLFAFQKELDYVFRTLWRLGTAPSEVDDLAQEVFLALRGCWSEYDTTRPLRPFLFGIAFRIASASGRKRRREVAFGVVEVDDVGPGPDDALQSKQARALVVAALEGIPLPRRAVLVMHELDGVPIAEIAERLSITRFGAYARLRKAHRELAAAVQRLLREGVPR